VVDGGPPHAGAGVSGVVMGEGAPVGVGVGGGARVAMQGWVAQSARAAGATRAGRIVCVVGAPVYRGLKVWTPADTVT
jgi:hypothetical protein